MEMTPDASVSTTQEHGPENREKLHSWGDRRAIDMLSMACKNAAARLRRPHPRADFLSYRPRDAKMVRPRGLEPPRCYPLAPQASASTNSAMAARHWLVGGCLTGAS